MMDLEELYSGIPDDSVNLTFQDLAAVKPSLNSPEKNKSIANNMETIQEGKSTKPSSFRKLPSLDFNRGLQETKNHYHDVVGSMHTQGHHHGYAYDHPSQHHGRAEFSRGYDNDMSIMSMNSMYQDKGGRPRRPGIPHTNICTVCSTYIYIFRHRCLVCGRVYCRNCVSIGMGGMTEGRKCIQCLGRKFSQRYIKRAGNVGCCSSYPSSVKQAELRWAEKGPRRTGERAYGNTTMVSGSRSPMNPRTPNSAHLNSSPPSFVSSSPYSPYSPNHHHLPL